MKIKLTSLPAGKCGTVAEVAPCSLHDRMADLGITEGEKIRCTAISPLGRCRAYVIKGSIIALRNKDATFVSVDTAEEA